MNETSYLSNNGNDRQEYTHISAGLSIVLGVVICLLVLAILTTNLVLILAIIRTPYLHTKTNALLACVATSELISCIFVIPFTAVIYYDSSIRLQESSCEMVGFVSSLATSSKSLSLLGVSLDRCIAISAPLNYSNYITKRTITVMIALIWTISLIFAALPLSFVGAYRLLEYHRQCFLDYRQWPHLALLTELISTVLPSVIIVISLVIVMTEAHSHHRVTAIAQLAIAMYSGPAAGQGVNYARSTYRAMRTFLIITTVYLCTCFPRSLYIVIAASYNTSSNNAFRIVTFLTYVCSLSTPVVITTLNLKFRQSIKTLFHKHNKVGPAENETYTISTGLQSILHASMAFSHVVPKEAQRVKKWDEGSPGPSRKNPTVVGLQLRKDRTQQENVAIFHTNDITSGHLTIRHAPLRKTISSP